LEFPWLVLRGCLQKVSLCNNLHSIPNGLQIAMLVGWTMSQAPRLSLMHTLQIISFLAQMYLVVEQTISSSSMARRMPHSLPSPSVDPFTLGMSTMQTLPTQ
jgi:hypothetical protein